MFKFLTPLVVLGCLQCVCVYGWRLFSAPQRSVFQGRTNTYLKSTVISEDIAVSSKSTAIDEAHLSKPEATIRKLGSMEKLLTQSREGQGPIDGGVSTLSTPHVFVAVLDGTLSKAALKRGVVAALAKHPMLRVCIRPAGPPIRTPLEDKLRPQRWDGDGDPLRFCEAPRKSLEDLADRILRTDTSVPAAEFETAWRGAMEKAMDSTSFDIATGPNWCLEVIRERENKKMALLFSMNHALDDQRSSNLLLRDILQVAASPVIDTSAIKEAPFPPSMEEAMLDEGPLFTGNTAKHMFRQIAATFSMPQMLPDKVTQISKDDRREVYNVKKRRTICEMMELPEGELGKYLAACRKRGTTLTAALGAACLMASSDILHSDAQPGSKSHPYKLLVAVDMRPYGVNTTGEQQTNKSDWTGGTVACAGGALDYVTKIPDGSGRVLTRKVSGGEGGLTFAAAKDLFWAKAAECKEEIRALLAGQTARESVAVFEFLMKQMDLWESCARMGRNPDTLGRAYSCGLSNMGPYPFETTIGPVKLDSVFYGTSQTLCGSLFQVSCGSVGGKLCLNFQGMSPLLSREEAKDYLTQVIECLRYACDDDA